MLFLLKMLWNDGKERKPVFVFNNCVCDAQIFCGITMSAALVSARQINTTDIVYKAKQLLATKPSNLSLKTNFNNLATEKAFGDFFVNLAESLC